MDVARHPEIMDKVTDNLWIGGLPAALDVDSLNRNGIKSILSAMRGRIAIQKAFARHQILLDDTDEADALVHFPACISWIDSEIKKGRGVLVHCQAGMSRSATIVAAYLMHTRNLDVEAALDMIRHARPVIQPNDGFVAQLAVFHSAHYKRTRRNKETRAFYVERAVKEVLNGDGSSLEMDMFAKFPRTPSDSTPSTPFPQPRRRLRCKMCRHELATREHMIDHGQVGPATPAAGHTLSPAVSRRPSAGESIVISRRGSISMAAAEGAPLSRRPSRSAEAARRTSFGSGLAGMTPISTAEPAPAETFTPERERRPSASEAHPTRRRSLGSNPFSGLSMTPMANSPIERRSSGPGSADSGIRPRRRSLLGLGDGDIEQQTKAIDGLSMSAVESDDDDDDDGVANGNDMIVHLPAGAASPALPLATPQELAAQIHPNLAALRSSPLISALSSSGSLGLTPLKGNGSAPGGKQRTISVNSASPPLLMPSTKCSGYFVEPMKWMEAFLETGNMAGKIMCPNKKCGAKLGNYDWAGVECSCKEWVVPGFCIHRSKVDEVAI